jgi:protocatechuate 3,4-dioxygenase alpha subunit
MERLAPTAGQTIGPFFAYGMIYPKMHEIVHPHAPGAVVLHGTVRDGAGAPIPDAMVEIWGADAAGAAPRARGAFRRDDHTFTGFGRAFTNDEGHFQFWVQEPGASAGRAPFFAAIIFARGLPDKLHTRIYLPAPAETPAAEVLAADPLLAALSDAERATLVATREPDGSLRHDIRLQGSGPDGAGETVFLAYR